MKAAPSYDTPASQYLPLLQFSAVEAALGPQVVRLPVSILTANEDACLPLSSPPPSQVAASINSGHDLVLTELMFNGAFNEMTPEQVLAACSCFVCQEKPEAGHKVGEDLKGVFAAVQEAARRVAKASIECRIEVSSATE